MAKSRSRKRREKWIRAGKLDPATLRGTHNGLYERRTKTKHEREIQMMNKYKRDLRSQYSEDLFSCLHICL
jgi:hypothetical protein